MQFFWTAFIALVIGSMLGATAKGIFLDPNRGKIANLNSVLKLVVVYAAVGLIMAVVWLFSGGLTELYKYFVGGLSIALALFIPVTYIFGTEAKQKTACSRRLARIQASPRLAALSTVLAFSSLGLSLASMD